MLNRIHIFICTFPNNNAQYKAARPKETIMAEKTGRVTLDH